MGAILVLAAFLRLWHLDLVEFKGDEAQALRLTEDFVRLGRVPLVGGPSSTGIQNPATFLYLLAPIVSVTRDPSVVSGAIGLANVAGLAGLIVLGWRSFSPIGGLAAGLAYATNPWAVLFARKIWYPEVLAPLAVLFFFALERAVIAKKMSWAVATFPLFAIALQIHFSFFTLAPLLGVPTVMLLMRRRWVQLGLGIGLAVLSTAPYLLANHRTDWADVHTLQNIMTLPVTADGDGPAYVVAFATNLNTLQVAGISLDRLLPGWVIATAADMQTALVGFGAGVALLVISVGHGGDWRRRLGHAGLLVWILLPAVLTIRHAFPLFDHYYLIVPPAAALLIGAGLTWLAQQPVRWARPLLGLGLVSLLLLATIQTLMVVRVFDSLAVRPEPGPPYGPPLARTEAVVRDVASFAARGGSQHLFVELWMPDGQALGYLARAYFPRLEVATLGGIGLGPRATHGVAPEVPPRTPGLAPRERLDLQYADDVHVLSAFTASQVAPGDRFGLAITWAVMDAARAAQSGLTWEVSLYDPAGVQLDRQSGIGHDLASIEQGELITSWFSLATYPGAARGTYEVRLRRLDQMTREPLWFVDPAGQSATEWRSEAVEVVRADGP